MPLTDAQPSVAENTPQSGAPLNAFVRPHKMSVRALQPEDASQFQSLRLRGLSECPEAFASSYDEEAGEPLVEVAARLRAKPDGAIFGWFTGTELRGIVGLQREALRKLAHKAYIWGMYVAPEARRGGVGRQLLAHALTYAGNDLGVLQVNIGVNTKNIPALKLYESLGFVVYGTERGFLFVNGALHDEYQMTCCVGSAA